MSLFFSLASSIIKWLRYCSSMFLINRSLMLWAMIILLELMLILISLKGIWLCLLHISILILINLHRILRANREMLLFMIILLISCCISSNRYWWNIWNYLMIIFWISILWWNPLFIYITIDVMLSTRHLIESFWSEENLVTMSSFIIYVI